MYQSEDTETSEGFIAHLVVRSAYGLLRMPVRLVEEIRDMNNRPYPEKDSEGNLRYAWPGGGSITREGVLCLSSVCATSVDSRTTECAS